LNQNLKTWRHLPALLPLPRGRALPAVIQEAETGAVLMLVELNREALDLVAATGRLHYYHPHKRKVVAKGEASGHFQEVLEIRLNCQGDQLLIRVRPAGGACELGYQSCFYRRLGQQGWEIADPKVFNPEEVYPEIAFSH
jgi:phosphoribosyl-AMP cyclohydrolase